MVLSLALMTPTDPLKLNFRRRLRHEQTDTERKLWSLLRSRQLEAYKFRRQHPIGPYVVDFCCLEKRLIVELDGRQHADRIAYDQRRTEFLQSKGYRVLRFWDNQVFKETEAVVEKVLTELDTADLKTSVRAKVYRWKAE